MKNNKENLLESLKIPSLKILKLALSLTSLLDILPAAFCTKQDKEKKREETHNHEMI